MGAHSSSPPLPPAARRPRAHDGIRTRDLFLTKEVLYRLSYVSALPLPSTRTVAHRPFNRSGGNRTPNRRFWRPVLYQLSY
jgi:hypothetical protein